MTTVEKGATFGVIGLVMLAGFFLVQEINAKTKEIVGLTDKVTALTKRLEVEKAKQPDAIQLATPQITTETKEEYIKRNTAPIDRIEFADMLELRVGDTVIYTSGAQGRVLRIAPMEGSWVVETTHGKGEYMRWGTEAHDGDGIRGVVR